LRLYVRGWKLNYQKAMVLMISMALGVSTLEFVGGIMELITLIEKQP